MNAAIQKREANELIASLAGPEWPMSAIDVVRRQVCPKGIPDDDFYVFMKKCVQSGLNPLLGEAFCIPRNMKGPDGKPVVVFTFQPSAEGMRTRAARFPDFVKVDGAAVYTNDAADVDTGGGHVVHKFNAAKPRGIITGAWGRVVKKDGSTVVAWLPAGSRHADGPVWSKDPGGHLAKCAMVQALRQAYPVAFGGIYASEEMGEQDGRAPSREQEVMQTLTRAEKGVPQAHAESPALPPPGLVVEFGEFKGRPAEALTLVELDSALADGRQRLESADAKARWRPTLEKNLAALCELRAKMTPNNGPEDAQIDQPPPAREPPADMLLPGQKGYRSEPGSDG